MFSSNSVDAFVLELLFLFWAKMSGNVSSILFKAGLGEYSFVLIVRIELPYFDFKFNLLSEINFETFTFILFVYFLFFTKIIMS